MIIKKTYIPGKPRNPKLVNSGGSRTTVQGGGGGMTSSQLEMLTNLADWWKLDEEGNLYTEKNMYSQQGVSALGLGEGGSGGGVDMLDAWANYTEVKANYYVPAHLLVPFRNDTLSRLSSLESGSATSIVTTGSGNAITSLTKSGSVITATKGLTFALASHTHTIAQITGLQGALDLKASQSDIDAAIDGIEIGGRNYILTPKDIVSNNVYRRVRIENGIVYWEQLSTSTAPHGIALSQPLTKGDYVISFKTNTNEKVRLLINTSSGTKYISQSKVIQINENEWLVSGLLLELETSTTLFNIYGTEPFEPTKEVMFWDFKLEKGNKATDWSPAPEDQVSDWNTTDVNSFSYIKNKPTLLSQFTDNIGVATHIANKANPHAVTTAQIGAVDLTTNQTIGGNKSFTGNVTAPTFIGALSGNASSATRLTTLNTYDANDITGGASFNYTSASYWINAPLGMGFGLIGNIISMESSSLSLQIAADINHNSTSSTKDLWFRTRNNLGFQNDWKKVWHDGNLSPVTTDTTQTITGAKTFSTLLTASAGINTPKVIFAAAGWSLEQVGTELQMKHNGVIKQRMLSNGTILATGGITALST